MELRLVYHVLRKISGWILAGFYSEVYVEGQHNVPKDGPLIIASSHHNEIVDIAALTATVPRRRYLSFWAKSTMFANPVTRFILLSSGSIPVHRNSSSSSALLFRETSAALGKEAAVAVFPEGTSHSEPNITQAKEGAARAAMEYVRWASERKGNGKKLALVPVGIVYTDKSHFQSRVYIRYGRPIELETYIEKSISSSVDEPTWRTAVRNLTSEIEKRLVELTINAPDWSAMYAARTARAILWNDENNIPLKDFVEVSQILAEIFSHSPNSSPPSHVKDSLIRYYSLLHYTSISHSTLSSIYPTPKQSTRASGFLPSATQSLLNLLTLVPTTFLHPRFLLFLPPLMCHAPAYLIGRLAAHFLAPPREEEAQAQFKALAGGLWYGIEYVGIAWRLVKLLVVIGRGEKIVKFGEWTQTLGLGHMARSSGFGRGITALGEVFTDSVTNLGRVVAGGHGVDRLARQTLAMLGASYGIAWVLFRWHNMLVDANYSQFRRLLTSYKIFLGILFPRSSDWNGAALEPFLIPPTPPLNPFIKYRNGIPSSKTSVGQWNVEKQQATRTGETNVWSSRKLIRPLLAARAEATAALSGYMVGSEEGKIAMQLLRKKGFIFD